MHVAVSVHTKYLCNDKTIWADSKTPPTGGYKPRRLQNTSKSLSHITSLDIKHRTKQSIGISWQTMNKGFGSHVPSPLGSSNTLRSGPTPRALQTSFAFISLSTVTLANVETRAAPRAKSCSPGPCKRDTKSGMPSSDRIRFWCSGLGQAHTSPNLKLL